MPVKLGENSVACSPGLHGKPHDHFPKRSPRQINSTVKSNITLLESKLKAKKSGKFPSFNQNHNNGTRMISISIKISIKRANVPPSIKGPLHLTGMDVSSLDNFFINHQKLDN